MPKALTPNQIKYRGNWIVGNVLDPNVVTQSDRNAILRIANLLIRDDTGSQDSSRKLRDMPPEERLDALYDKVFEAFEGGLDANNAQMVGRVLDHIDNERKREALQGNLTINICPWYIPDHVPDQLYEKAFDGVEIDGMVLDPSDWKTVPDPKQLAQAIAFHADRAGMPFGAYLTHLQESLEYAAS